MKKIIIFAFFLSFFYSCSKTDIDVSKDNVVATVKDSDGIIDIFKKQHGKVFTKDVKFVDNDSEFILRVASINEKFIENYLNENKIVFRGVTSNQKKEILQNKQANFDLNKLDSKTLKVKEEVSDLVVSELISYKLGKNIVGYGMTFTPNQKNNSLKNARVDGLNWHQPSIPWCEYATLNMYNIYPTEEHYIYFQVRGWFWNGSGIPLNGPSNGAFPTNGQSYGLGVDGPKFTRFGGYDPVYDKFNVTWYDWDSGAQETN